MASTIIVGLLFAVIANAKVNAFHVPVRGGKSYSSKTVAPLYGTVLSRSSIISAAKRGRNKLKPKGQGKEETNTPPTIRLTRTFLVAAFQEAIIRQERIITALEKEMDKASHDNDDIQSTLADCEKAEKLQQKAQRRNFVTRQRLKQVTDTLEQLNLLREALSPSSNTQGSDAKINLNHYRNRLEELGFVKLLTDDPATWKWVQQREFGRPSGFGGLVFYSPLGVPILVGQQGAHADDILRRVAAGSDLWFQVNNYQGSRVLLRSSMVKGLKDSKDCRSMAADLAAYFSESRFEDTVPVMYTHSKLVAKRGSKRGQMKQKKTLGTITGRPRLVEDMVNGQEP